MSAITLPYKWQPRPYQEPLWRYMHSDVPDKRAIEIAHRRWGKDEIFLHYVACAAHERTGAYWHLLPEATQARKAIWDAVNPHTGKRRIDEAFPMELRETTRENEMFIKFKVGSTYQVIGSDRYDALVGSSPAGIGFSEWALSHPQAWSYVRPILAENHGWAMFITSPRGRNHAATMYDEARHDPNWFAEKSTALDTGVFTQEQLDRELAEMQRELGKELGQSFYDQEYLASFDAPVIGAVYAGLLGEIEKAGHITTVEWDPGRPVYTSWDLGYADACVIWYWQVLPGRVNFIDYDAGTGWDAPAAAKIVLSKPYVYGDMYVPHDARHKTQASPTSFLEQLQGLGVKKLSVVRMHSVADRISAGRILLRRAYFDHKRCKPGLEAMRAYHFKWDEVKRKLSDDPVHDAASDPADAYGYGAVSYQEINPAPFEMASAFRLPTLNDVWAKNQTTSDRRI